MEEGRPSSTALAIAIWRAEHLLWDDPAKIFEDTLALRLCGCENETAIRAQVDRWPLRLRGVPVPISELFFPSPGFRKRIVKPVSVALPNSFSSIQTTAFFSRR